MDLITELKIEMRENECELHLVLIVEPRMLSRRTLIPLKWGTHLSLRANLRIRYVSEKHRKIGCLSNNVWKRENWINRLRKKSKKCFYLSRGIIKKEEEWEAERTFMEWFKILIENFKN